MRASSTPDRRVRTMELGQATPWDEVLTQWELKSGYSVRRVAGRRLGLKPGTAPFI